MPLMPFLINPAGKPKKRSAKSWHHKKGAFAYNPRKRAKRKLTTKAKVAVRAKRAARRKRKFSPAQLRAQRAFAAMAKARSTVARKARSASVNPSPRRKGGSMATRKRKRRATTSHRRRRRRPVAANPRRRRRRRVVHRNPVARRRRRHTVRHNPRRRHVRRNPGLGGIGGMLVRGLKDGFVVRLGGGLTQYVSKMVPIGQGSAVTQGAIQLAVGTALSLGVKKFMGERAASFFLAGAASQVIGAFIPNTIPVVGPILGSGSLGAYPMGAYPALPAARMGAYPRVAGLGTIDDNIEYSNISDGIFS